MKKLIICTLVVFLASCSNKLLTKKNELRYSSCQTLRFLSDSNLYKNPKKYLHHPDDIVVVMNNLFIDTKLDSYRNCDFMGCNYFSLSLNKSIYKIDLLRLMQYYSCSDTAKLKESTKGLFTQSELDFIRLKNQLTGVLIDTSLLYK